MPEYGIHVRMDPGPAARASAEIRRDLRQVDESAVRLQNSIDGVGKSMGRLARARAGINGAVGTLGALGIGAAVSEAAKLGDEMTALRNKLGPVAQEGEDVNKTFERLRNIARETRGSVEGTVTVYSRMAQASRELGVNQDELFKFTERLSKAVKASGANTVEATQGMIQLSQGMALGTLRGQDLKSVLEQIPYVADLIAKHLHVTRGQLLEMGAAGKIGARDVFDAISNAEEVDAKFNSTVATTSEKFQRLKDDIANGSGALSKFVGFVVDGITQIAEFGDNLDRALHPEKYAKEGQERSQVLLAKRLELQDEIVKKEEEYGRQTATGKLYVGEQLKLLREQAASLDEQIDKESKIANAQDAKEKKTRRFADGLTRVNNLYKEIVGSEHGFVSDYDAMIERTKTLGQLLRDELESTKQRYKVEHKSQTDRARDYKEFLGQFHSLEDSLDDQLAARHKIAEAEKLLNRAQHEGIINEQRRLELLDKVVAAERERLGFGQHSVAGSAPEIGGLDRTKALKDELKQQKDAAKEATKANDALNEALKKRLDYATKIQRELERTSIKEGTLAGMRQLHDEIGSVGDLARNDLVDAFNLAENAMLDFFTTGKFNAQAFTKQLERMALQLAFRYAITQIPGFATGGDFIVPGSGGTDTVPIAFRATPGERVTIQTPAQQAAGAGMGGGGSSPVRIVNVYGDRNIAAALQGTHGEEVVINHIGNNREKVARMLGVR